MRQPRQKMLMYLRFISHSFNELLGNEYGQLMDVDEADDVFEDLFGMRNFVTKVYAAATMTEAAQLVSEIGTECLVDLFDSTAYIDALRELIQTKKRMRRLKKDAKKLYEKISKSNGDYKPKHKEQDLAAYKSKSKELRYAQNIYDSAIKKLRKYLGVKNPGKNGFTKKRYSYLKNFAKRSDDEFTMGGFGDPDFFNSSAFAMASDFDSAYIGSLENDTDEGESRFDSFVESEKRRRNTRRTPGHISRRKVKTPPNFPGFEMEEEEDEDDWDVPADDDDSDEMDHRADVDDLSKKIDELNRRYSLVEQAMAKIIPTSSVSSKSSTLSSDEHDLLNRLTGALMKISSRVEELADTQNTLIDSHNSLVESLSSEEFSSTDDLHQEDVEPKEPISFEDISEKLENVPAEGTVEESPSKKKTEKLMDEALSSLNSILEEKLTKYPEELRDEIRRFAEDTEWQKRVAAEQAQRERIREATYALMEKENSEEKTDDKTEGSVETSDEQK